MSAAVLPPEADRDWLAAQYVAGLAEGATLAEAERLAETDPAFAALVAAWRRRLDELDRTAQPAQPSENLWPGIVERLDAPSVSPGDAAPSPEARSGSDTGTVVPFARPAGADTARSPGRSGLALWRGIAAAASLVAAVSLGALWLAPKPRPELVAVLLVEPGKPGAVVEAFADGRVRLVPLQDLAVPEGRALQVWTLRDRAQGPISVGLMPRARTLPLDLGTLPDTAPDQLFEITLEPATGSPTGKPTGPVLMKGLASRTL